MLGLADRLKCVAESATLKMNAAAKALAAQGVRVINFSVGETDFEPFVSVRDAVVAAVEQNFNKYTAVPGIPELRKALSEKLARENGLTYKPEEICVTVGGKQAIFNFLLAALNPGDEVIIPAPFWVSYPEMVKIVGGSPVILPTTRESRFKISEDQLRSSITPKTKALILNSPSNPTGMMYSKVELEALARVLEDTNIWVLSDEIYERLVYDGKFVSFASLSQDAFGRTLTVNGFSKTYAMTGWRIGYAAGPKRLIDAMSMIQGQSTSGAASIVQKGALAALSVPSPEIEKQATSLRARRAIMSETLKKAEKLRFVEPDGAFYFFIDVSAYLPKGLSTDDLALNLLKTANVATVSGSGFGLDGHLRLSFALSEADVREGCEKIVAALGKL